MTTNLKAKYSKIILRPRITEKANLAAQNNVYIFEVSTDSTKAEIKEAVKVYHKVTPIKINITKNPVKSVFVRGRKGKSGGVKKALVFLKKGDKIE